MAIKKEIELDIKVESVGNLKQQLREAQKEVEALSDKFGATSEAAIKAAKEAYSEVENREAKITELENKIAELAANESKQKFSITRNTIVKKKATAPAVNRYGMPSPKKIRTEVSNAGIKSKNVAVFSKLTKKIE